MSSKPTNKTTQWREDFEKKFIIDHGEMGQHLVLGASLQEIPDFFIAKHLTTLELLEKEIRQVKFNTSFTQTVDDVLAIIRQHKEV